MITGTINKKLEIAVDMPVYGCDGRHIDAHFVVDTGFDGEISLPPDAIEYLRLPKYRRRRTFHADSSSAIVQTYVAHIKWDDEVREVIVNPTEGNCLIGVQLLKGFLLTAGFVPDAPVKLERFSEQRP